MHKYVQIPHTASEYIIHNSNVRTRSGCCRCSCSLPLLVHSAHVVVVGVVVVVVHLNNHHSHGINTKHSRTQVMMVVVDDSYCSSTGTTTHTPWTDLSTLRKVFSVGRRYSNVARRTRPSTPVWTRVTLPSL